MRSRKILYRPYPLFVACFIFCGILVIFYIRFEYSEDKTYSHFFADDTVSSFLIDTSGCQIPAWNPWDDSVQSIFKRVITPYKCSGPLSFLRVLPNSVISLEEALLEYYYEVDLKSVHCTFQEIQRNSTVTDKDIDNRVNLSKSHTLVWDQPLGIDFIKTTCHFDDNDRVFSEFLPLTPLKSSVERRCLNHQSKLKAQRPVNVMFIGIDSISHLNFIRHFPKCQDYLTKYLSPITMNGYNKVGDNTFPNLVPLLTGHSYQFYYDDARKNRFFDDVDFSWKAFADLGYRTLLAEDAPDIATFNYYRNGFKSPPTDYYYRPFALAVEKSDIREKQCFGSKMEMEVIYDYLKSFLGTMNNTRPFFAFSFLARLTHDVFNFAGYADEPTYQLLKHLNENNFLDNTMLVFFSDHGIRYGDIRKTRIGQYEERLPFMHLIMPKWFLKQNPTINKNLVINSERLTSPYDIHSTILHLASMMSKTTFSISKLSPGLSLFHEIPANRTCSEAGISPHWCTCQVSKPISKSYAIVEKAAETVIDTVNNWTRVYEKCSTLVLDEIFDARVTDGSMDHVNISMLETKSQQFSYNYLLIVSASPSQAMFEATVRCTTINAISQCKVIDDISRINEYGKQSDCISDVEIKKFCFCL
ncbi:uncharacterized protein [Parasteatoda tepidariorum]|uniref:uncharacterized protein n=1 Tax=Parasteatoda tepidariorum TaxID=114398 RepID=UPI00077FA0ED|nr:uncharacterized protein LOC107440089 [Parasteatoda tepidariorum]XP_042896591.1 uncharacterized protein LOC107440089 [Parasteatoda tepidariorum]